MSKNKRLKVYLKTISNDKSPSIESEIAKEALDYNDGDVASFFKDLLQHGCQSGMVGSLIYYADTHAFYDKHYDEIESIRAELEDDFGQPLTVSGDLKNWFAWLSFEETARKIADKFNVSY